MPVLHRRPTIPALRRWVGLGVLLYLSAVACEPGTPPPPDTCNVTSLELRDSAGGALPASTVLAGRGASKRLSASLENRGTCPAMTWSTSHPAAVSVASTGATTATVTAQAPADFVTVSVGVLGTAATTFFHVTAGPVHHMAITPANPSVVVGQTRQLAVELFDQDDFPTTGSVSTVTWSLSAPGTITISPTGLVTAVAVGTVTVTATYTASAGIPPATTTVTVTSVPMGSVTVTPATASIAVGATATPFTATIRDINGTVLPNAGVTWQSQNPGVATVGAGNGAVTGVSAGTATIRAIADGNVSIFGDAVLTVTAPPPSAALIAYALADQPASASYTPDPAAQFNGQGGQITVTRSGTGQYTVTIPGFGGGAGDSRIPFVNAFGATGAVCLPISWTMIGVADATVRVDCSTPTGALTDSKFTIFAAGQGAFPGRFAFANSGPLPGGSTLTLGSASAWSASGNPPQLTREGVGRFLLNLRLPTTVTLDVPVVQPANATTARCSVSSWGAAQDIVCYPVGSAVMADAQFSGMYVGEGRPGKRFGAYHPGLASVSRNSAGGTNSVASLGGGVYRVTFGNLGRTAGGTETVLVTAHALFSATACNPSAWSTVGNNLVVDVACFDGAGAGTSIDFVVVVIE